MFVDLKTQTAPQTTSETTYTGAPTENDEKPSAPSMWVPLALVFGIFYFLLIRPEKKRRAKTEQMLDALKKGDEVMTNSGIFGRVAQIHDDKITVEVAEGVRMKFARGAVQAVIGKDDSTES